MPHSFILAKALFRPQFIATTNWVMKTPFHIVACPNEENQLCNQFCLGNIVVSIQVMNRAFTSKGKNKLGGLIIKCFINSLA
jgi:hypothetical protein